MRIVLYIYTTTQEHHHHKKRGECMSKYVYTDISSLCQSCVRSYTLNGGTFICSDYNSYGEKPVDACLILYLVLFSFRPRSLLEFQPNKWFRFHMESGQAASKPRLSKFIAFLSGCVASGVDFELRIGIILRFVNRRSSSEK